MTMKRIHLFFLVLLICPVVCHASQDRPQPPSKAVTVPAGKKTPPSRKSGGDSKAKRPGSALKQEVIAAVRYALGLEQRLLENPSDFRSRNQVYEHFRKGFSHEMAERLTRHSWADDGSGPRSRGRVMEPPDTVHVSRIDASTATAFYETPKWIREMWGRKSFTVIDLARDEGLWVVVRARGADNRPVYESGSTRK
jgi:hypothetical protein